MRSVPKYNATTQIITSKLFCILSYRFLYLYFGCVVSLATSSSSSFFSLFFLLMLLLLPFVNASYYNLFCVGSWIEYDRFGWCSSLWWYIHVKCAIWPISKFVFVFVFFSTSSVAIKQTKPSCIKRNSNLVCNLNALPILQLWCFRLFRSKIAYESLVSMDYRFGTNSNQMHQYNC